MADTTKRIIDLQTTTELAADSYVMIDGAVTGTKKYLLKDMDDAIKDLESGSGLDTGAVSTNAIADAAVTNAKLGTSSVATVNLQNGAVTLDKIASGSEATSLASGLMSSTDKAKLDQFVAASNYALKSEIVGAYIYRGSVPNESSLPASGQKTGDVYNIVAASSYGQAGANVAWNGSGWDTLGETFEIGDGTVTTAKIANLGVTEAKLGGSAVTTDKIGAAAVTESKLATSAVTENKLATSAVTTNKINNLAVTTGKLASGAVTTEKVADGNVTTAKLGTEAVTTVKIADGNVTTVKIADGNVTEAKLANGAVTTGKISDAAITSAKLGSGAVIETKINDGAVTTSKLATNAVTTAKITDANVTEAKLASDSVATTKIKDSNVTTAKIADLNVTEGKLANSAVTTNKLNNSAVTTAKIADANVTTAKIADLNVTEGKLANAAVTTDKVADGAITRDKFAEEVTDELDFKADVDGYYTDMTVGAADNLTSRGDAVAAEYLYRTSGGTADIETGQATIRSIKGNTLRWNQLAKIGGSGVTKWGLTVTKNSSDNTVTISGTATAYGHLDSVGCANVQGHKYLIKGHSSDPSLVAFSSQSYGTDAGNGAIITNGSANKTWYYSYYVMNAAVGQEINVTLRPQIFDLTAMFGAGNEPSTVAEFEALYPEPYYPYDAGSLLSVNMEGIETTGFNQWDEVWEVGGISANGTNNTLTDRIRSKNYIPVFEGQTYHFVGDVWLWAYDAGKNFYDRLSDVGLGGTGSVGNKDVLIPSGVRYIRFTTRDTYGTTYKNDICINLHWSGRRDGEYEAYWSAQRAIDIAMYFPTGLKKAGTVYDELTATEAIQRVYAVTLNGTEAWVYGSGNRFYLNLTGAITAHTAAVTAIMDKLPLLVAGGTSSAVDGFNIAEMNGIMRLFISIEASHPEITTADAFKTWLASNNLSLYYSLKESITTPIDPPLNLSYRVDDFGTERIMVPTGEMSAPPVMEVAYGLNVVDFVRRAPTQYISVASFAQYLLARDAHDGTTTTMTWDDTNNRYEFTITDVAIIDEPSS